MMQIGLNLWAVPSAAAAPGASYVADFAADRYFRAGEALSAAEAYGVARSSAKYAPDSSGAFILFGANVPARTDLGLLVEGASSNLLTNPVKLDAWATTLASAASLGGAVLNIFTQPTLVTDTGGNVVARLRHPLEQSVVAEQSYAISYWFRAGSVPFVGVVATGNSGNSRMTIALSTASVSSSGSGRGAMTLVGLLQPAPGIYCAQVIWVPNFSGPCEVAIGPGTGVVGDTVIALGAFMEPGTAFTSPMIGTGAPSSRTADNLTLHLPPGAHDLTFTFADMSTQVIAGATGSFAVPGLGKALIREVVGVAI